MKRAKFLCTLPVLLLLLFQLNLYAQGDVTLKNGIYLTWEEFKNNSPSVEVSRITPIEAVAPQKYFCTPVLQYFENDAKKHIRSNAVWGLAMNGKHYIRIIADDWDPMTNENCFFQLFGIEALSKFFVVEGDRGLENAILLNSAPTFREYILEFRSGKIHNLWKDLKKIIKIIKTDSLFIDEKIDHKNIRLYIGKYNKNNPPNPFEPLVK